MNKPYESERYFGMALDPIHIGTGGYRLGRVDNTIARDPATNLPIIFGSSIEGTARTYSAYKLIEDCNSLKAQQGKNKREYLNCAGKSIEEGAEEKKRIQCGECEICITYGFSKKEKSLHGMAQLSDAKILFFPVHSMIGPVWVTSPQCLKEFSINETVSENKIKTSLNVPNNKLNLGWLYLEKEGDFSISNNFPEVSNEIRNRSILISDNLFHQIVNSNLEVRTSVSIDPQTGAAEEHALFTYEAIPRSTIMYFDVVFNNPENFDLNHVKFKDNSGNDRKPQLSDIQNTVKKGLCLFEHLGLGGMGTRGFGRFKVLNLEGGCNGKSK